VGFLVLSILLLGTRKIIDAAVETVYLVPCVSETENTISSLEFFCPSKIY
jgi:hypothetical protein